MTVKDRLLQFLKRNGLSQGTFEESVGVSNGFVNNMGDAIRPNSLRKIAKVYPDLNTAWLLTGEGNMLRSDTSKISGSGTSNVEGDLKDRLIASKEETIALLKKQTDLKISLDSLKSELLDQLGANRMLLQVLYTHLVEKKITPQPVVPKEDQKQRKKVDGSADEDNPKDGTYNQISKRGK